MHYKQCMSVLALSVLSFFSVNALGASLEQAKQLHDRIAGVAASQDTLQSMATLLDMGKPIEAVLFNHIKAICYALDQYRSRYL
jgi:hypothetical protein